MITQEYADIVVATVTTAGVLGAAWFNQSRKQLARVAQAESEIKYQKVSMGFGEFLTEWKEIESEIETLFQETRLERFIIFQAFNGMLKPRWTTGIIQLRKDGVPFSYVHVELDEDYIGRLLSIKNTKYSLVKPTSLAPCMIKDVYLSEGVTESLWAHIKTKQLDEHRAVYTYCSFATSDSKGLDLATITRCKTLTGRLKSIAINFPGAEE